MLLPTLAGTLEAHGSDAPVWVSARTQRLARALRAETVTDHPTEEEISP